MDLLGLGVGQLNRNLRCASMLLGGPIDFHRVSRMLLGTFARNDATAFGGSRVQSSIVQVECIFGWAGCFYQQRQNK